jgi:hypothetical protein
MRIAIVGAGLTGLSAARLLSEDPRHATTVFETRARFGGPVERLFRLGVTLRHTAQVERLAVDDTGVDLWIHGRAEGFDLALVTTSPAEAGALLARSGIRRHTGSMRRRVYFTEHGADDGEESARDALVRMGADHPIATPPLPLEAPPRVAVALRSLARRAGGSTAVQFLDLSGHSWPLRAPAIYIANQRWILDVVPRHLMIRGLRTPEASDATAGALEAGNSVAFVVEGESLPRRHAADAPHGRGAALAALAVNAPIVPIAAATSRMRRPRVVIGELFYPETSSIDELMDDMRMVVRYLERLAVEHACASAVTPLVRRSPSPARARRSFLPRDA